MKKAEKTNDRRVRTFTLPHISYATCILLDGDEHAPIGHNW